MRLTTTGPPQGPGLALEIAGLCAFVVPSDGQRPIEVLCPGVTGEPRHKPYLLVPLDQVDPSPTDDPDFTLELARTTQGLWSVDGCRVTIEAPSLPSGRPRLPEGSTSPEADGFWDNIWHHLADIGRLVSPARISAQAVEKCAASMVLAGGDRSEIVGLPPAYRGDNHFSFEPKGRDQAYEPHLTDRVRYWLGSTRIQIVLTPREEGRKVRKVALIDGRSDGQGKPMASTATLWNLPSSLKSSTHGHPHSELLGHFTAFYNLLEGPPHPNPPVPRTPQSDPYSRTETAFCPPAVIEAP